MWENVGACKHVREEVGGLRRVACPEKEARQRAGMRIPWKALPRAGSDPRSRIFSTPTKITPTPSHGTVTWMEVGCVRLISVFFIGLHMGDETRAHLGPQLPAGPTLVLRILDLPHATFVGDPDYRWSNPIF